MQFDAAIKDAAALHDLTPDACFTHLVLALIHASQARGVRFLKTSPAVDFA